MKRKFVLVLIVLTLLASPVSALLGGGDAEAAAAERRSRVDLTFAGGPFGLPAVKYTVSAGMLFKNGRVYAEWRQCTPNYAYGYSINTTWCGTVWNGSTNYMEVGANFSVHVFVKGFPAMRSCWMRIRIYTSGYATHAGGC